MGNQRVVSTMFASLLSQHVVFLALLLPVKGCSPERPRRKWRMVVENIPICGLINFQKLHVRFVPRTLRSLIGAYGFDLYRL